MSGVFGIVGPPSGQPAAEAAGAMGRTMAHRPWYVVEHAGIDEGIAIGRVGIGLFNASPQPVWNAARTAALVMAGELYRDAMPETGDADVDEPGRDERLALALYARHGSDFARHLNGAFVVAVWDLVARRLLITNDRHGVYPTYYRLANGTLRFAPEVKALLGPGTPPLSLDLTALAQYVRFQHLLGERTFFEGIHLVPTAAVIEFDPASGVCRSRRYWSFDDIPHRPAIGFGEAVEETGRLLRRAVRRMSSDRFRPGVYLSGGLDSRTLLGLCERRPVVSLTFGHRNCRDVHLAARVAKVTGSDHHWFDLPDGRWVEACADFHLDLTEGFHSWIHAHGMSTMAEARALIDVNLTGWDGGGVMGHPASVDPLLADCVDDRALMARMFQLYNQSYSWPSLLEGEEGLLYAEPLRATMRGRAFDSFREELEPYLAMRTDVRSEYFLLQNHCRRLTQNMIVFLRSHIEVRCPFLDYDLFDFLYSIPASIRAERRLYRAVIHRETPRLAFVPYDYDEFLPTPTAVRALHAAFVKAKRRVNRHIGKVFRERDTLYADYEGYLRGDLRAWAEGILYDRRTVERGLFDPSFVKSLMNRHLSAREPWTIGKIAPFITYELMLRRFLDSGSGGEGEA